MSANEIVPFLAVSDMSRSLRFYVDGLGFVVSQRWIDEGIVRWCRLELDGAGLMLQQFRTDGEEARTFSGKKGEGVVLCIFCKDAVGMYRSFQARGAQASEPVVGNGLWVTRLVDPDGYLVDFESPTEVAEDTGLSEFENN